MPSLVEIVLWGIQEKNSDHQKSHLSLRLE